jgi:hypothetical protein
LLFPSNLTKDKNNKILNNKLNYSLKSKRRYIIKTNKEGLGKTVVIHLIMKLKTTEDTLPEIK